MRADSPTNTGSIARGEFEFGQVAKKCAAWIVRPVWRVKKWTNPRAEVVVMSPNNITSSNKPNAVLVVE
jgi:hypothetical protein